MTRKKLRLSATLVIPLFLRALPQEIEDVLHMYQDPVQSKILFHNKTISESTRIWQQRAQLLNGLLRTYRRGSDVTMIAATYGKSASMYYTHISELINPPNIQNKRISSVTTGELAWIEQISHASFQELFGIDTFTLEEIEKNGELTPFTTRIIHAIQMAITKVLNSIERRTGTDASHKRSILQAKRHINQLIPSFLVRETQSSTLDTTHLLDADTDNETQHSIQRKGAQSTDTDSSKDDTEHSISNDADAYIP